MSVIRLCYSIIIVFQCVVKFNLLPVKMNCGGVRANCVVHNRRSQTTHIFNGTKNNKAPTMLHSSLQSLRAIRSNSNVTFVCVRAV